MLHASPFLRPLALATLLAPLAMAGCDGGGGATCSPACGSTQQCCDGTCVFVEIDRNNCGACGIVCNGTCTGGMCTSTPPVDAGPVSSCQPACGTEETCCGTICVDKTQPLNVDGRPPSAENPTSPFNNCNGCGVRCDPERSISCSVVPTSGSTNPQCACGDSTQCFAGDVCVQDQGRFTCINFNTNARHCGGLNQACAEGEGCMNGECVCGSTGGRCGEGQACCNHACIDITSDAANCGGCGNACGETNPNCIGGTCRCGTGETAVACVEPGPGSIGQSCCDDVCVDNSNTNCGCGVSCEGEEECIYSEDAFMTGLLPTGLCCGTSLFPPFLPAACIDFL